ncbi:MAG TPA: hypothetical protein IGS52_10315 [Oscillatoriaceae cyanobacterium M33_DOE_052]|nr:hypothetical protein [Oscillatoriaceae cyanobacterium M33_DOE_052]
MSGVIELGSCVRSLRQCDRDRTHIPAHPPPSLSRSERQSDSEVETWWKNYY